VLPARIRAFGWAETQARKPYAWGGTGTSGYDCSGLVYDCSGLVMEAYLHAGVSLPRTTDEMLAAGSAVVLAALVRR